MRQQKQIDLLNEATNKALDEVRKKRINNKKTDFIQEFHEWVKIVKKYLKEALH
jgi:hypothetical protein